MYYRVFREYEGFGSGVEDQNQIAISTIGIAVNPAGSIKRASRLGVRHFMCALQEQGLS